MILFFLPFGSQSGFKIKFVGSRRVRACNFGLRPRSRPSKWGPFTTLCEYVCRDQQRKTKRIHPPPTNSKYRVKSFCEVGYTSFRPNVFAVDKRICMEILVGGGVACMIPSSIKKICNFFKKWKCARKIFIVFVMLSDLNKTSNRAVTHTYNMYES